MTGVDRFGPNNRTGGRSGADLGERAAAAARAELRGERENILGAMGVATRAPLARAQRTEPLVVHLRRVSRRASASCRGCRYRRVRAAMSIRMPIYLYEPGDLNSQLETYELERMARLRNPVRILPSPAEIDRMDALAFSIM